VDSLTGQAGFLVFGEGHLVFLGCRTKQTFVPIYREEVANVDYISSFVNNVQHERKSSFGGKQCRHSFIRFILSPPPPFCSRPNFRRPRNEKTLATSQASTKMNLEQEVSCYKIY